MKTVDEQAIVRQGGLEPSIRCGDGALHMLHLAVLGLQRLYLNRTCCEYVCLASSSRSVFRSMKPATMPEPGCQYLSTLCKPRTYGDAPQNMVVAIYFPLLEN